MRQQPIKIKQLIQAPGVRALACYLSDYTEASEFLEWLVVGWAILEATSPGEDDEIELVVWDEANSIALPISDACCPNIEVGMLAPTHDELQLRDYLDKTLRVRLYKVPKLESKTAAV